MSGGEVVQRRPPSRRRYSSRCPRYYSLPVGFSWLRSAAWREFDQETTFSTRIKIEKTASGLAYIRLWQASEQMAIITLRDYEYDKG
jgi:hypothetical protein